MTEKDIEGGRLLGLWIVGVFVCMCASGGGICWLVFVFLFGGLKMGRWPNSKYKQLKCAGTFTWYGIHTAPKCSPESPIILCKHSESLLMPVKAA